MQFDRVSPFSLYIAGISDICVSGGTGSLSAALAGLGIAYVKPVGTYTWTQSGSAGSWTAPGANPAANWDYFDNANGTASVPNATNATVIFPMVASAAATVTLPTGTTTVNQLGFTNAGTAYTLVGSDSTSKLSFSATARAPPH